MYTQKMNEVQKHMTLTNHGYIGYVVVANKKFWDGLPGEIRGQLEKAMKEATEFSNAISEKENTEAMEEIKKAARTQIHTPTGPEEAAMRKAMEPLYADMGSRVGKALIEEFLKTTASATH
jgi:C4-dicarboxylate-binding protein DctP